jgi:hypothetical protein
MNSRQMREERAFCQHLWWVSALAMAIAGAVAAPVAAGLTNGDFAQPLGTGWRSTEAVTFDVGCAILGEDLFVWASLEQGFTLPGRSIGLSFDYLPRFEQGGIETFTASLLDSGYGPLVTTDPDPEASDETYYFMHDWCSEDGRSDILTDRSMVTVTALDGGWTRVRLDLTGLGGIETEALLAFDLVPGLEDASLDSRVVLDNVAVVQEVPAVPLPEAFGLGVLGCVCLAGGLRQAGCRRHP